jgi:hypothetical protein
MSRGYFGRYLVAAVVIEGFLWLLPGGKYGSASGLLVGSIGIAGSAWCLSRYVGLRSVEGVRFFDGSRRAEYLYLGLMIGTLGVGLLVMTADGGNSTVMYATAVIIGAVWMLGLPFVIVGGRRRMRRESGTAT